MPTTYQELERKYDAARAQIAVLEARERELREALVQARPFVEYAYKAEDGEEAAEAKHVMDKVDSTLEGK